MERSTVTDDEFNSEGQEDAAESCSTVTVPKWGRDGEVIEWMEVEKEWLEYTERVEKVYEQVREMVGDEPGVNYTEISCGEEKTKAGWTKSVITVLVADEKTADRLSIPDEIDGIPMTVKVGEIHPS